jgi:serine/threonine protein kinase
MEQDLTNLWQNSTAQDTYARYLANGYWRDVWTVKEASDETTVLKTMRYEHDYTPRNYDRHRRDAVAMERLTSSRYILDIYAFCGNSGLFEFASGGSLTDNAYYSIDAAWTPKETLIVAHQVASGIDAVHHFEKDGVPAIAHTDISPDQ